MIERQVDITTPDGQMPTFVHHPTHGGPHPVVLYFMDAPGMRPALHEMASRLASAGYYVLLPWLFYRGGGPPRSFGMTDEEVHERQELMGQLDCTNIVGDAQALLDFADADGPARDGDVGAVGFCMSGPLVISVARAMPERVAAAASIHGAWMVRDTDDSPHLGLERVRAELHLAWCDNDPTAPPETIPVFRKALDDAGVTYTFDFHEDAVHGFAPAGQRYHREASELHWERVHSLFRRRLWHCG